MRSVIVMIAVVSVSMLLGCQKKPAQQAAEAPPAAEPKMTPVTELPPAPPLPEAKPPTPAQPPKPAPGVTEAPAAPTTYVVQKGDTLFSIARIHLGDGKRWKEIVAINPGLSERIKPGQKIVLPAK